MIIALCHIQLSFPQEILHNNTTHIIRINKFLTSALTGAQEPANYVRLETSHYPSTLLSLIHLVLHFTFFARIEWSWIKLICHRQQQYFHISRFKFIVIIRNHIFFSCVTLEIRERYNIFLYHICNYFHHWVRSRKCRNNLFKSSHLRVMWELANFVIHRGSKMSKYV